ncbi:sulfatase-like hydrolase/transferase [Rhizophagus clarus]|uniref:Sulfatase-like hydrolase/transferase n=1 Tax=Rhizophagus clarus TaxID=94130 RepID=A0A8H3L5J7_9GLOM|nr:sulfatase-like hydrolase/transferase [Rhizophagus clarus]
MGKNNHWDDRKNLQIEKYSPLLNENFLTKLWIRFSHLFLNNPNYDSFLILKVLKYIENKSDFNFLFIHLVDTDEVGHLYGFKSKEYMKKLYETDKYVDLLINKINKHCSNPLILITTDHGGKDKSHGGNSDDEINVFIGSNSILDKSLDSNMCCSSVILNSFGIAIPTYFDNHPQI